MKRFKPFFSGQICYEYVYNQSNMGNGMDQSTEASQEKGHTGTLDKYEPCHMHICNNV